MNVQELSPKCFTKGKKNLLLDYCSACDHKPVIIIIHHNVLLENMENMMAKHQ